MARSVEVKRTTRDALSGDQAEELFSVVDQTGHPNAEKARRQHDLRREIGESVEVDPLAGEDPSGANTDRLITRSAILFVSFFLVIVMLYQVGWGYVRRVTTSTLAEDASMRSVVFALNTGVEWGGGFTQFPSEFTVQEADEHTHRIEVTVTDSESSSELDAFATAQVQASALSVNALLNPNIDTVTYHVKVRRGDDGRFQKSTFFGFFRPTGAATPFMTFVWTKTAVEGGGVRFDCSITGVDSAIQQQLHDAITSKSTPATIISNVIGDNGAETAEHVLAAATDNQPIADDVAAMKERADQLAEEKALEQQLSQETSDETSSSEQQSAEQDGEQAEASQQDDEATEETPAD